MSTVRAQDPPAAEAATDPRDARIAALEAQVDALACALRPFAEEAWKVDPRAPDTAIVVVELFAGKLRHAREAVETVRPRRRTLRPVPRP